MHGGAQLALAPKARRKTDHSKHNQDDQRTNHDADAVAFCVVSLAGRSRLSVIPLVFSLNIKSVGHSASARAASSISVANGVFWRSRL